ALAAPPGSTHTKGGGGGSSGTAGKPGSAGQAPGGVGGLPRVGATEVAEQRRIAEAPARASDPCVTNNTCTAVSVFFGTNRARKDLPERISFSAERTDRLQLGKSVVTVPKAVNRRRGDVVRPTWFEVTVLRIPPAGNPAKHFTIPVHGVQLFDTANDF